MKESHDVISHLLSSADRGKTTRQTKKGCFIGISLSCFILMAIDIINGDAVSVIISCAFGIYMMAAAFHVGCAK